MRTLLTLALAACAVAPAAAQTVYYQGGTTYAPNVTYGRQGIYSTPYVQSQPTAIVRGQRTYSNIQPRVAYSYAPATYGQPSYSYSQPTYSYNQPTYSYSYSQPTYQTVSYPRTYAYTVQAPLTTPQVVYSTPTYSTPIVTTPSQTIYSTPMAVYSSPRTIYSTPSYTTQGYSTPLTYSTPVTTIYSQPVTWSQPMMSYSSYPTMTYGQPAFRSMSYPSTMALNQPGWSQPQFDNVVWSQPQYSYNTMSNWNQPYYGSAPMVYSQSPQGQDVVVSNPFQTQPTLNFVPSGSYDQRLMQAPSGTRGYAGRRAYNYYR